MTKLPTLCIIINNHNYGCFLAEAIESALAQTYAFTEVVVVDDGSTDDSRAVIARYAEQVRVVLKPNGGQVSAFNAGFEVSTGDIIVFLDSDDRLAPDAAERVVSVWRPGLSKVHYRLRDMKQDGTLMRTYTPRRGRPLQAGDLAPSMAAHGFYHFAPHFRQCVLARCARCPIAAQRDGLAHCGGHAPQPPMPVRGRRRGHSGATGLLPQT